MSAQWICPACHSPLHQVAQSWRCEQHHQYDIAKQGYVNLHLVQHKKSKHPGDSVAMVNARRTFLQQGHYAPLTQLLADQIVAHHTRTECRILDAGCGEGYYLKSLAHHLAPLMSAASFSGVDIAKAAVAKAAKGFSQGAFAVASTFALPVAAQSHDVVTQIFAPAAEDEIHRVLTPDGLWIHVQPGPRHLFELKQCVYDTPAEHDVDTRVPDGFDAVSEEVLRFTLNFAQAHGTKEQSGALALLMMTPFYWTISADKQAALPHRLGEVTADFHISVWRRRPDS